LGDLHRGQILLPLGDLCRQRGKTIISST
jgi:hypothetical protein